MVIPVLQLETEPDRARVEELLARLRLDPRDLALGRGEYATSAAAVQEILAAVAERGDAAIVESARKFDDPNFSAAQIRVTQSEMGEAAKRVPADQIAAVRRSIAQVREYQSHVMPADPLPLLRPGVELGMRFTP